MVSVEVTENRRRERISFLNTRIDLSGFPGGNWRWIERATRKLAVVVAAHASTTNTIVSSRNLTCTAQHDNFSILENAHKEL